MRKENAFDAHVLALLVVIIPSWEPLLWKTSLLDEERGPGVPLPRSRMKTRSGLVHRLGACSNSALQLPAGFLPWQGCPHGGETMRETKFLACHRNGALGAGSLFLFSIGRESFPLHFMLLVLIDDGEAGLTIYGLGRGELPRNG